MLRVLHVKVEPGQIPKCKCPHCGAVWLDYTLDLGVNNALCSTHSGCGKRVAINLAVIQQGDGNVQ